MNKKLTLSANEIDNCSESIYTVPANQSPLSKRKKPVVLTGFK